MSLLRRRCSRKDRCQRAEETFRFATDIDRCVKVIAHPDSIAVSAHSVPVSLLIIPPITALSGRSRRLWAITASSLVRPHVYTHVCTSMSLQEKIMFREGWREKERWVPLCLFISAHQYVLWDESPAKKKKRWKLFGLTLSSSRMHLLKAWLIFLKAFIDSFPTVAGSTEELTLSLHYTLMCENNMLQFYKVAHM